MSFRSVLSALARAGTSWAVLTGAAACSSEPAAETEPACLDRAANLACEPLYGLAADGKTIAPTFQEVFDNTLHHTCAAAGCHRAPEPPHGLELDEIAVAYTTLLAKNAQGEARVIPKDVRCGKVIVRLESAGKAWSMPPGPEGHLQESELCSIRHWIANGAVQ